ncbi:hypothetical protein [Stagnimonas aquatica]|uniref:hypothetical protein n=1 Tax=Stagnimonas aquatica TaxID=2689987 RepID=UPI0011CEB878|nr:hypothetical protein [Stagnimonas aquatica]
MQRLADNVLSHLKRAAEPAVSFWLNDADVPCKVQDHCDVIYSLCLLNRLDLIAPRALNRFASLIPQLALPGWNSTASQPPTEALNVHNFAYLLGTLNILKRRGIGDLYPRIELKRKPDFDRLFFGNGLTPKYPAKFTHHAWRVSHWLGGVPSILLSLSKSVSVAADAAEKRLAPSIIAINGRLNPKTGMIREYQSEFLQHAFRFAYQLRHDPDLGDLGGVAHILWVNWAMGIPYVASEQLAEASVKALARRGRFLEGVPYCLDFDLLQIARTATQAGGNAPALEAEASRYLADIEAFFAQSDLGAYTLHKFPGALATYAEAQLVTQGPGAAIDIIKDAYWL